MEEEERHKILTGTFGYPLRDTKDLNGVPVYLRTLYDWEIQEAIHKALQYVEPEERLFYLPRWKLAYSLIAVNENALPEDPVAKFTIMKDWLNFYVEQLIRLYDELAEEEADLGEILKNSGGTQTTTNT